MKSAELEIYRQCARYCSVAERCAGDVKKRLDATNLDDAAKRRILEQLVNEYFISEVRYSKAFVNDKFRFNQWGRKKIVYELKKKGIPSATIYEALNKIDPGAYLATLKELLVKKRRTVKAKTGRELLAKLVAYGISKGFEADLIFELAAQIIGMDDETMD